MKKTRKNVQVGLGAASILMIFVILCMMVLSTLAYATARQSEKIALREQRYEQDYQKANTKAQIFYALLSEYAQGVAMQDLMELDPIKENLKDKTFTYQVEGDTLYLDVQINDKQKLSITLYKTMDKIEKQRWKLVSTGGQSK